MPLPDNFSPVEHLQDTIRRTFRTEIREWFRDIDLDGDLDINTPRSSLALACEHRDDDSFNMTIGRIVLFETLRGRFAEQLLSGGSDGIGVSRYKTNVHRRLRPQIVLRFAEDISDVEASYAPVYGRISFRLMSHDPTTITEPIALTYANRIKTNFATGGGFVWKKGKELCSYSDWEKGYQLQLLCRSEAEGRRVVEQVLDIQQDTPQWAYFNHEVNAEPATAYPTVPEMDRVYGKNRRLARVRPIADVRFQWAKLFVHGMQTPIILVDRSGILLNSLAN
ncbi:hypothetical protein [Adonisia turfae]|uniref:Uncharacterized protein n=1 Tax=Adonisia turfae CCMR0081 TaxID=2292702 RepID=A0A6M0RQ32_9CYAN|nr:hypothetical protein [Adonisia turfae]NEZ57801.1 hypothetical protein [Adonisia turfae CCMR0081]